MIVSKAYEGIREQSIHRDDAQRKRNGLVHMREAVLYSASAGFAGAECFNCTEQHGIPVGVPSRHTEVFVGPFYDDVRRNAARIVEIGSVEIFTLDWRPVVSGEESDGDIDLAILAIPEGNVVVDGHLAAGDALADEQRTLVVLEC